MTESMIGKRVTITPNPAFSMQDLPGAVKMTVGISGVRSPVDPFCYRCGGSDISGDWGFSRLERFQCHTCGNVFLFQP